MHPDRQEALLRRYLACLDGALPDRAAHSVRRPASVYVDAARFARERARLFRGRPLLVGLGCELGRPGAFLTTWLGDVPAAVVRQPDGGLRGFVNACRHRGAPLLAGAGNGLDSIVCPYHAWCYGLDGALRSRPLEWGFDDVPAADCALHQVAVAERFGLVFAQADAGGGIDVDEALQGMEVELAEYRLEGYTHFESRSRVWDFNWKLVLDTFTEPYHIPALHRRSIARDYDSRNALWDRFGHCQRTVNFRSSIARELEQKPEGERRILPHTTIEYFVLPNAILTHQLDHVELWRAVPLAVDRTLVTTSLYAPQAPATESARRHWKKNLDLLLQVTETEDFALMLEVQRALASGALPELIQGRIEPALIHLHDSLDLLLQG